MRGVKAKMLRQAGETAKAVKRQYNKLDTRQRGVVKFVYDAMLRESEETREQMKSRKLQKTINEPHADGNRKARFAFQKQAKAIRRMTKEQSYDDVYKTLVAESKKEFERAIQDRKIREAEKAKQKQVQLREEDE